MKKTPATVIPGLPRNDVIEVYDAPDIHVDRERDMLRRLIPALLFVLCANCAWAEEPPIRYATRGETLYLVHCINCHSAQMHWRDQKIVTDWHSLKKQVRRWQENLSLEWNKEDIEDVARYLNVSYYKYPWVE